MVGNSIKIKSPQSKEMEISELVKSIKAGTVHLTCWMTEAQLKKLQANKNSKVLFKEFSK